MSGAAVHCLRCGTPMVVRAVDGRERPVCPSCGYIFYRNPTPVAGCVVEHEGRIVLVRRGINPGKGQWGLPAGFMEWGETAEEGAMRETTEETGLLVRIERLLGVYSFVNPVGNGVIIFYVATSLGGMLVPGDDAEHVEAFAPGALPDAIAFPTHRQALADYIKTLPQDGGGGLQPATGSLADDESSQPTGGIGDADLQPANG